MRPNPDVLAKRLDKETVLVHLQTNRIFELNETGSHIWLLLEQGVEIGDIAGLLTKEFDVDRETAAREVERILQQFSQEGLLLS